MNTELSLMLNKEAVCPYCRTMQEETTDLRLFDGDCDIMYCSKCGLEFNVEANFDITYSTSTI